MVFKIVVLASVIAIASAGGIYAPAPLISTPIHRSVPIAPPTLIKTHIGPAPIADGYYDPNPQYSFGYDVQDALTGDFKNHYETRSGDIVQGTYSLIEPDGTRRVVEYYADPHHGFNAAVHKEPIAYNAPAPIAKIAAPLVHKKLLY